MFPFESAIAVRRNGRVRTDVELPISPGYWTLLRRKVGSGIRNSVARISQELRRFRRRGYIESESKPSMMHAIPGGRQARLL